MYSRQATIWKACWRWKGIWCVRDEGEHMFDEFLRKSTELKAKGEVFAVATVVRSQAPSSGKQGDRAIVHADGEITGWIGGGCAQPVVVKEALKAIKDGKPRMVRISPSSELDGS